MSQKNVALVRSSVSVYPDTLDLFNRLAALDKPNREMLRLMQIGLKWERFDADPLLVMGLFTGASRGQDVAPEKSVPSAVAVSADVPRTGKPESVMTGAELMEATGITEDYFSGPPASMMM